MIKIAEGTQNVTIVYDEKESYYLISTSKYMKSNEESDKSTTYHDETLIFSTDKNGRVLLKNAIWGISPGDHDGIVNKIINGELTRDNFDINSKGNPFKYDGFN